MATDIAITVLERKTLMYFPTLFHGKPRFQNQKPHKMTVTSTALMMKGHHILHIVSGQKMLSDSAL